MIPDFFQPVQLHLELADFAVESLRLLVFNHRLGASLALEQALGFFLDGFFPLPYLHRVHAIRLPDLVDRLDALQGLKPYFCLELRAVDLPLLLLSHDATSPYRRTA